MEPVEPVHPVVFPPSQHVHSVRPSKPIVRLRCMYQPMAIHQCLQSFVRATDSPRLVLSDPLAPERIANHQHHIPPARVRACVRACVHVWMLRKQCEEAEISPVPATAGLPVLITRSWRRERYGPVWATPVRRPASCFSPYHSTMYILLDIPVDREP